MDILTQLVHPLALLLWVAAALAWLAGTPVLTWAILAVIAVHAVVAFVQERQAARAVDAMGQPRCVPSACSATRCCCGRSASRWRSSPR